MSTITNGGDIALIFIGRLRCKSDTLRVDQARELLRYVSGDFKEKTTQFQEEFLLKFDMKSDSSVLTDLVSSSDSGDRKAGIFMIVCLVESYLSVFSMDASSKRILRFAQCLLRKSLICSDQNVMPLSAKALAYVAMTSKTNAAELVELCLSYACEWLEENDRNETRRMAAVLLCRELARSTPTFFYQISTKFFEHVFKVVKDPKPHVREHAVEALRAALVVTSQREIKQTQKTYWYSECFEEAERCLHEWEQANMSTGKEERVHSALLLFNELIRIANSDGERIRQEAEELYQDESGISVSRESSNLLRRGSNLSFGGISSPTSNTGSNLSEDLIDWLISPAAPYTFESRTCGRLMADKFETVCEAVLKTCGCRAAYIHSVLMEILPRLAAFDPSVTFVSYLPQSLEYLLLCLQKDKDKRNAFTAVGLMAVIVKGNLGKYVPRIMEQIRLAIPTKDTPRRGKSSSAESSRAYLCLTLMVQALHNDIEPHMRPILQPMFNAELSAGLTVCLREVAREIPTLREDIQNGLIYQLSLLLMDRPIQASTASGGPFIQTPEMPSSPVAVVNTEKTILGLRTLGNFQFPRHSLEIFLKYIAKGYLHSDVLEVRLAAVRCCARLLMPFVLLAERTRDADKHMQLLVMIHHILRMLLSGAVTDQEHLVRLCVFDCLSEPDNPFFVHLAQAEMLQLIFMGLQDEVYVIRETVVCLLGRLGDINPAYVMPKLRRVVLQCVSELQCSGVALIEQQSAQLLAQMARFSPRFIRPYLHSILTTLMPKLRKDNRRVDVVVAVLNAIGQLAQVGAGEVTPLVPKLMPLLIDFLQDATSLRRREVALRTLGQVVRNTGYVTEPYQRYPALLDILLRFLRTEQTPSMRRETIRVLGILGALDPYQHKVYTGCVESANSDATTSVDGGAQNDVHTHEMIKWFNYERCTLEEFYPALAISLLMEILSDSVRHEHHKEAVHSIVTIFQTLGTKCGPYIEQVVPKLLPVIRNCKTDDRGYFFEQLGSLIGVVRSYIKPFLKDIFNLIAVSWSESTLMRRVLIHVVEQVALSLGCEFKPYVADFMPFLLRVFIRDDSDKHIVTLKVLGTLKAIAGSLEEHLHLIIPPIVKLLENQEATLQLRTCAVSTLCVFCETMRVGGVYGPRVLHAWLRVVGDATAPPELKAELVTLLLHIIQQMHAEFLVFQTPVEQLLVKQKLLGTDLRYEKLLHQIHEGVPVQSVDGLLSRRKPIMASLPPEPSDRKQHSNKDQLKKTWSVKQLGSKEDWSQWLTNLRVQLLKQSPYPALRSCASLADLYAPLARDLFNAAFMSVWTELTEQCQNDLTSCLLEALKTSNHSEVIQTILNVAEFMDHSEKGPLPVPYQELFDSAMATSAYAKGLRYKELQIHRDGTVKPEDCEALITLTNKLQLKEEAVGVVQYAKEKQVSITMRGRWYEKLHQWQKALEMYEMQQSMPNEDQLDNAQHRMRCLEALGDWTKLSHIARDVWSDAEARTRPKLIVSAANGAWGVGDWEWFERYVSSVNRGATDGSFLRAVLSVQRGSYRMAQQYIDRVRQLIDTDLTAMSGESYERAYGPMVTVQRLSELEEAIQYKQMPERRAQIAKMWWNRLQICRENVEDWQRVLMVRSLVLSPTEMGKVWMKFAALCRRNDRLMVSRRVLHMLLEKDGHSQSSVELEHIAYPADNPQLTFACAKQLWVESKRAEAFDLLKTLVEKNLRVRTAQSQPPPEVEMLRLTAKCYLKLGAWLEELPASGGAGDVGAAVGVAAGGGLSRSEAVLQTSVNYYRCATDYDKDWYKAWHAYASSQFAAVLFYKSQLMNLDRLPLPASSSTEPPIPVGPPPPPPAASSASVEFGVGGPRLPPIPVSHSQSVPSAFPSTPVLDPRTQLEMLMNQCALRSVECFLTAICLCKGSRLQDTLRLLTLWFDYGHRSEVYDALLEGLKKVPVTTWLEVIPQLIARIDTRRHLVARLITNQLEEIGKIHPQALVYPLTVAYKSPNVARSKTAKKLLDSIGENFPVLVQQAKLVSEELIRVAILWHELWHEGLEEASRQYFQDRNSNGMFATLAPLHDMIRHGGETIKEQSFYQNYHRDLTEARENCEKFKQTNNYQELTKAWDLYYTVFKKISKQLPQLTQLELQYVSPGLMMCRDVELAIPGTYDPSRETIRIHFVHPNLQVISSKQRPRKICMRGSDGKSYWFCLKGHEDPRQDERVMQLFRLVNTLLLQEPDTCRHNLTIQRYSITPLSQNSGLIGWVQNCDTLHALLKEYREKKKILLNIEHKLMQRVVQDYDHLTLMQKVEVFEHALENTNGNDLQRILWLKSPSSETWFDRRTNFTRSLATMSMVGYILGLGDRHPSNLMLGRISGKIIHIDFGDCFEVAMNREKYPEKIPFRFTRMLVNAMEVTGIEGNFKITCERVLRVLREHRESVLAVLEAFVYDPLINWRLVDPPTHATTATTAKHNRPLLPPSTGNLPPTHNVDAIQSQDVDHPLEASRLGADGSSAGAGGYGGRGQAATNYHLGHHHQPPMQQPPSDVVNKKAKDVIERIREKLTGKCKRLSPLRRDGDEMDVAEQVARLIDEATSHENLCQCYIGWCPFW